MSKDSRPRLNFAAHILVLVVAIFGCSELRAQEALVAVATNFSEVMVELKHRFEDDSGYKLRFTTGSTGILYAQLKHGAPFDVLLAADQRRPKLLVDEGYAVPDSRFTYAIGQLSLWTPREGIDFSDVRTMLRSQSVHKIAMANPRVAPYGVAALQTLAALGLEHELKDKFVMGENIGQAHALAATGNADVGFVALSYVKSGRNEQSGSRWDVPQDFYEPIRQDAVLMKRAEANTVAKAFFQFLGSATARGIISQHGYDLDD